MMDFQIKEYFKQCEEFIDNCTPEELLAYEKSLCIDPKLYTEVISFRDFVSSNIEYDDRRFTLAA